MSLFRSHRSAAVQPDFSGLALQTSTAAAAIPIVYGTTRVAPNIIWSGGATARPQYAQSGGGKGGGGSQTVSGYEYYEWLMFAIGEGPIAGVSTVYLGHASYPYGALSASLLPGTTPQQPWAPAAAAFPAAALPYGGTAYVACADFDLGSSASMPAIGFEVEGLLEQLPSGDADPAAIVADLLTNPQYGAGFPAGSLDAASLGGGPASYASYCGAAGLALSPALVEPETASAILARWLALTNTAAVWSGGRLRLVPYGDAAIGGPQPRSLAVTVAAPFAVAAAPAALYAGDLGVGYAAGGALAPVAGTPAQGQYALSGNSYGFSAADAGAAVVIRYLVQPAAGFVPDTAPVYDLGDDDFVAEDGRDPVEMTRSDPKAAPNVQRLECLDRANNYAATPIEARDQAAIEAFGLNPASTVTAHEICDLGVALASAQLILQRGLYVRNSYGFRLSWECALLEPMDVVTLTDPGLGLDRTPVRITAIGEDEDGLLAVTAEEFTAGLGTAAGYPAQAGAARPLNRALVPAAVNPPLLFEPPPDLAGPAAGGGAQVWAAVSGGVNGVADPNWGGATVWASRDGASYGRLGEVTAPARQGVLAAPLRVLDVALAVDLSMSGGVLAPAGAAQADATLMIVGTELVAYAGAQLTGPNRYLLTGLRRALHGSSAAAHPAGTAVARLDAALFKAALPQALVGVPLALKFQSRNVFGGGTQDLSTCQAYPYTPVGSGLYGPTAQLIAAGASLDEGLASLAAAQLDDYGLASDPFATAIDDGLASA